MFDIRTVCVLYYNYIAIRSCKVAGIIMKKYIKNFEARKLTVGILLLVSCAYGVSNNIPIQILVGLPVSFYLFTVQ